MSFAIFDGPNRTIILRSGTTAITIPGLWSAWVDWLAVSDNSKYLSAFRIVGGDAIDPVQGTTIPFYLFLENSWKIRPQEANHTLSVSGGTLIGFNGTDPFINTLGAYNVRVVYSQPVQAIGYAAGGGGGGPVPPQTLQYIEDLARIHGLIPGQPLQVSTALRVAGSVTQQITEVGGVITVERQ